MKQHAAIGRALPGHQLLEAQRRRTGGPTAGVCRQYRDITGQAKQKGEGGTVEGMLSPIQGPEKA